MSDYRRIVGRRVLVILEDLTIEGTLEVAGRQALLLSEPSAIVEGRTPQPIDGEALIPLERIRWVQIP